jgi:hypothetical protein
LVEVDPYEADKTINGTITNKMGEIIAKKGNVTLTLTHAEVKGLLAFANEGAEGLTSDAAALRAYVGTASQVMAAERALQALRAAAINTGR